MRVWSKFLLMALAFTSSVAGAEVVTYNFSGAVTSIILADNTGRYDDVSESDFIGPVIKVGDTYTGTLTYNSSAPVTFQDQTSADYAGALLAYSLKFTNSGVNYVSNSGGVSVQAYDFHALAFSPTISSSMWSGLSFFDGSDAHEISTALPLSLGNLSPASFRGWLGYEANDSLNTYISVRFSVSSISAVPEPETYAMLLAGLGLVGTIARRRQKRG